MGDISGGGTRKGEQSPGETKSRFFLLLHFFFFHIRDDDALELALRVNSADVVTHADITF